MELTKVERLLLYNQYRILSALHPDEKKFSRVAEEVLLKGYRHDYKSIVEGFHDDLPVEISKEVIDVLQMYRCLHNSYLNLSNKRGISEADVKFAGFDGNKESGHCAYVDFFIQIYGRYKEFADVDPNSHWPNLDKYRKMMTVWKQHGQHDGNLNKNQISKILQAGAE